MTDTNHRKNPRDAAQWYALIHDEAASASDWDAFRAWLEEPGAKEAFQEIREAAALAGRAGPGAAPARAGWRASAFAAARVRAPALAAGLIFILIIGAALLFPDGIERSSGSFATVVGERQELAFADGSQATLNTDTRLSYRFGNRERRVQLAAGQAIFDVAPDRARPFIVETPLGDVRALGTQFEVFASAAGVRVTLLEGEVRVTAAPNDRRGAAHPPVTLHSGEQVSISSGKKFSQIAQVNVERATGWRNGKAHFVDATLADAVTELNRYTAKKFIVRDRTLAARRLSGVFSTDDPDAFAASVELFFGAEIVSEEDGFLITPGGDGRGSD